MKSIYISYSDAQLAELLNLRDMNAFEEIYQRYWQKLFAHAYTMLKDADQAEDIVQDIFTNLFTQMGRITYHSTIASYLYTSVRNMVLNVLKHQSVKSKYAADFRVFCNNGAFITDNLIRENELKRQIENAIYNLPPRMREVFELSRKSFLNHKEIAEKMGSSPETVKRQISKAIIKLRAQLSCLFFLQIMNAILLIHRLFYNH